MKLTLTYLRGVMLRGMTIIVMICTVEALWQLMVALLTNLSHP